MSNVVLGCDDNGVNDSGCQSTVASILEKAGHTVEKIGIAPGPFADYSYSSSAKGKIGVYLMADSIVSIADLAFGNTNFKYAYFIIRGDLGLPRMHTMEHFKNNPIRPDADCTSVCDKLAGKTYVQMNEIVKNKCQIIFGTTPEEMGNNLVKAMGGETTNTSESTSSSTIKSAICDVMYNWDAEAELFIRDETVHIRKIPSPSKATLSLVEGDNIHLDSINISDYNPSVVNYLTTTFEDYELTIQDELRVKRFGKVPLEVTLDEEIKTLEEAKEFLQREWNKLQRDNGHSLEVSVRGHSKWQVGKWCRVYIPSFGIDDFMYIINMSQDDSASDKWKCNLTLVDYPPSFGEPSSSGEDATENGTESEDNVTDTTTVTGDEST